MKTAYLPVLCSQCARVQLQPVQPGLAPKCRSCGIPSSVLPGEAYVESDVPLFERIEACVHDAGISRGVAERVVWELRYAPRRAGGPDSVLRPVVRLLPALGFLTPGPQADAAPVLELQQAVTRATGMLLAIASARLRGP